MRFLLLMALLSYYSLGARAQNNSMMETKTDDTREISRVLEHDYFKGIYLGDTNLLRKVYHPGTLLFGDVKGQPYSRSLVEYLEGVAKRQSPKELGNAFASEILDIRITNSIAIAEVKVRMYDFNYHEYLSFHKINGKWLIVNKMISDVHQ